MSETTTENVEEKKVATDAVAEETEEAAASEENVEEMGEDVESIKTDEVDYKAKFFYLAAELENLKKRQAKELSNTVKFGSEKILSELLEVVDNLDRTLKALENDEDEKVKNIVVGIEMVRTQFLSTLKNNGLEPVEALGKVFDPNFHEAMAQQPAEGKEDQEILEVYQEGYVLNGRLLRPAKVIVVKN